MPNEIINPKVETDKGKMSRILNECLKYLDKGVPVNEEMLKTVEALQSMFADKLREIVEKGAKEEASNPEKFAACIAQKKFEEAKNYITTPDECITLEDNGGWQFGAFAFEKLLKMKNSPLFRFRHCLFILLREDSEKTVITSEFFTRAIDLAETQQECEDLYKVFREKGHQKYLHNANDIQKKILAKKTRLKI